MLALTKSNGPTKARPPPISVAPREASRSLILISREISFYSVYNLSKDFRIWNTTKYFSHACNNSSLKSSVKFTENQL